MNGSGLEVPTIRRNHARLNGQNGLLLSQVVTHLQRAIINFDVLGFTNGALTNLGLLISIFHQPTRKNIKRRYDHMKTTMPIRVRISRFLEERYVQRAQPHYLPELVLFGITVITAVWPVLSLALAMETVK
jgi:hypothetical protein